MFGSYQFVSGNNLSHNHNMVYSQQALLPVTLDVSKTVLRSANISVTSQDTSPVGLTFSPSGRRMYMIGSTNDRIFQYNLTTAFDVSTAVYTSKEFYIGNTSTTGPGDLTSTDVKFHPEGHTMYIVGSARDTIWQYSLSTAWNITTATYASKSKSVSAQDSTPQSIEFGDNGTKMYMLGSTNDRIFQYTLTTPWDISTATYASKFLSVASQENSPLGMAFSNDGKKVLVVGSFNDDVHQYTLSTAWDISTASYDSIGKDVSVQESTPHAIALSLDQTKMFILGSGADRVYTYQRST